MACCNVSIRELCKDVVAALVVIEKEAFLYSNLVSFPWRNLNLVLNLEKAMFILSVADRN